MAAPGSAMSRQPCHGNRRNDGYAKPPRTSKGFFIMRRDFKRRACSHQLHGRPHDCLFFSVPALALALALPLIRLSPLKALKAISLLPRRGGSGGISAAIDGRSGNTERENYTVGGRLHYQARDTGMLIVTEHSRGKAANTEIEDNTWVHARYRDEFQRGLAAEAFVDHLVPMTFACSTAALS
jgi:hypothetical protein